MPDSGTNTRWPEIASAATVPTARSRRHDALCRSGRRLPGQRRLCAFGRLCRAAGLLGTPEQVAQTVLFAVSNDYLTGTVIELDGGLKF